MDNTSSKFDKPRIYAGWKGGLDVYNVYVAYSDSDGAHWNERVSIPHGDDVPERDMIHLCSDSDGNAFAVWSLNRDRTDDHAIALGFSQSGNGGQSWAAETRIQDNLNGFIHSTSSLNGGKTMRVSTYPTIAVDQTTDDIYVVWAEKVSSQSGADSDIYFTKSTNGGQSWSPKARVNTTSTGDQWDPYLTWDPCTSGLVVVYLDSRNF